MKYFIMYKMAGNTEHVYYTASTANESVDVNLFTARIDALVYANKHMELCKQVIGFKIHTL